MLVVLYNFFFIIFFVIYENEWEHWFDLLSKNKDLILNKAKYFYKNNKERLKEHAWNKYRSLSEEEKNKKREYGKNRYHNMPEEKKQRLKEYQKNYYKTKKSQYNNK